MFNSNEPIKVAHLQKLANQSMLNGALVIEIVSNESNKNFGRLVVKNTFPLDFIKYQSLSEVQSLFQICYRNALSEQVFGK